MCRLQCLSTAYVPINSNRHRNSNNKYLPLWSKDANRCQLIIRLSSCPGWSFKNWSKRSCYIYFIHKRTNNTIIISNDAIKSTKELEFSQLHELSNFRWSQLYQKTQLTTTKILRSSAWSTLSIAIVAIDPEYHQNAMKTINLSADILTRGLLT